MSSQIVESLPSKDVAGAIPVQVVNREVAAETGRSPTNPANNSAFIATDAVKVDISDSAKVLAAVGDPAGKAKAGQEPKSSFKEEEAGEVASKFEKLLNEAANMTGNMTVRFKVDFVKSGKNELNFEVVNKETGEIIHQYPPDQVMKSLAELDMKVAPAESA